jgi:Tol biopolymer transport system component
MPRLTGFLPRLVILALLLMPGAAAAQQGHAPRPEASPVAATGWEVVDQREITVDGEMVTLSPDGQWIAGTGPENTVCIWAVETLEPTCATVDSQPDHWTMQWSPDGTAIVWTHRSTTTFQDSDLYIMDVPAGTVTNLTDDQVHAPITSFDEQPSPGMVVDQAPAWTPDSQTIVFARLEWGSSGAATGIYSISRTGGEPQFIHQPEADEAWTITFPMHVLSDGSILYPVTAAGSGDFNGLWLLPPGGEPRQVMPGTRDDEFPSPIIVDVHEDPAGTVISGTSLGLANSGDFSQPIAFQLDLGSGAVTPSAARTSPATFAPDGTAFLQEEQLGALVIIAEDARSELGMIGLSRYATLRGIDWASNNTLLILQGVDGATLISVSPMP